MRGVTIKWDTSTPPEITDIDGLDENLKDIDEQLIGVGEYLDQLDIDYVIDNFLIRLGFLKQKVEPTSNTDKLLGIFKYRS